MVLDIDECSENTDNCSQNCSDTLGSYQCVCYHGYSLDSDQHSCNGGHICSILGFADPHSISSACVGTILLYQQILTSVRKEEHNVTTMPLVQTLKDLITVPASMVTVEMGSIVQVSLKNSGYYYGFH